MRIDLDAARAEAKGETFTVVFGGEDFAVPAIEDWPLEALDQINGGRFHNALQIVLEDDWERFNANRPTMRDCEHLIEGMTQAQGVESVGNS